MSGKCYKKETIGVAYVDINDPETHKGLALRHKEIVRLKTKAYQDCANIYAACIYLIIKDEQLKIQEIIICGDEPFEKVQTHLKRLLSCSNIKITQLDSDKKSLAHGKANSYRKRALKENLWSKGIALNVVKVKFKEIKELLSKMNKKKGEC